MILKYAKNKKIEIFSILILWLSLTSAHPFIFCQIPGHPHKLLTFICLGLMFQMILLKKSQIIFDYKIFIIIALQIMYFLIHALLYSETSNLMCVISIFSAGCTFIFCKNFVNYKTLAKSYILMMIIIGVLGVIAFFLAAIGLLKPIAEYQNVDTRTLYNFIFTFTNSMEIIEGKYILRIAGFFDEPGTMAFFLIFALLINKVVFNSKKSEILILISGFFTFSLAFYIIGFFYLLFFYFNFKSIKKIKKISVIFLSISIILFSYLFYNIISNDQILLNKVYKLSINRIILFIDRGIESTNREKSVINAFQQFIKYPFFGTGRLYYEEYLKEEAGKHSIVGYLLIFGVIGVFFMFLHVWHLLSVCLDVKILEKKFFNLTIFFILFLNFCQRPYVIGYFNYFSILILIECIKEQNKLSIEENIKI